MSGKKSTKKSNQTESSPNPPQLAKPEHLPGVQVDWKGELRDIVEFYNRQHATRNKVVSHLTYDSRGKTLFCTFTQIRALGYKISPWGLRHIHIVALMNVWTGEYDPKILQGNARAQAAFKGTPYSPATIQKYLSCLRVFAGWIRKKGLVLPAERYVKDQALVKRSGVAKTDKSWSGAGIEFDEAIKVINREDPYVGTQLTLCLAFGLRRKEAVMFRPALNEVPWWVLPRAHRDYEREVIPGAESPRYVSHLRVFKGTKGGRMRFVAVRNDFHRRALELAAQFTGPDGHVGRPGMSLKQNLDRYSNVLKKLGFTKKKLGVIGHGLRVEFAGDFFVEISNSLPNVRGGDPTTDPEVIKAAYWQVARQLGHNRASITRAYLG